MVDQDPNALLFAVCHEAGSLLTALRFHAAAPASGAADAELRALTTQLGTRIGALLALVRPLLEGPREVVAGTDVAQLLDQVVRELGEAGVEGIVREPGAADAVARCDPELLRALLLARVLAVVEPEVTPVRVRLGASPCGRGVAIVVEDDAPAETVGDAPSRVALVEGIATSILARVGGAVVSEHTPNGHRTRLELATA